MSPTEDTDTEGVGITQVACDYDTQVEYGKKKISVFCENCTQGRSELSDRVCRASLIDMMVSEYNVNKIMLSAPIEKIYMDEAIELIRDLAEFVTELRNVGKKDPVEKARKKSEKPEKEIKKMCDSCEYHPTSVFDRLENMFKSDYGKFLKKLQVHVDSDDEGKGEDFCEECRGETKGDCEYILNESVDLSDFILYSGYNLVIEKEEEEDSLFDEPDYVKFYDSVNYRILTRGIPKVLKNNKYIRPSFSSSWLREKIPSNSELVEKYNLGNTQVKHYLLKGSTESLYYLSSKDYDINEEEAKLINSTIVEMSERYPEKISMEKRSETREYIISAGRDIMRKISRREGYDLGSNMKEVNRKLNRLSRILARHTAGLGVLESLLKDHKVEDIYVDAPAPANSLYVELGAMSDEKMSDTCRTNLILGKDDIESILSRFRMESGRPFSESDPVLEYNMNEFDIRVTVIGEPLSPEGTALALRRHSEDPWTLLRLIANGTLTPLSAGLFSFLIDGDSTILVAGSRGAGKTSLLGALMLEFPVSQRLLTIEDTLELPTRTMQKHGYKVQNILVGSDAGGTGFQKSPGEALRVSLRLGESAIVMGEVRGEEAKTLYEAMRAGTAGSSVLGTFHADSPESVFERAVYDIGVPAKSFMATDIVAVQDLKRPGGRQKPVRKLSEISEVDKETEEDGTFRDLMKYDSQDNKILETDVMRYSSQVVGRIARQWGMTLDEAYNNIQTRAKYRELVVERAKEENLPNLLSTEWVKKTNAVFWEKLDEEQNKSGKTNYDRVLQKWKKWFDESVQYA